MSLISKAISTGSRLLRNPKNVERASGAVDKLAEQAKNRVDPSKHDTVEKVSDTVKEQLRKRADGR